MRSALARRVLFDPVNKLDLRTAPLARTCRTLSPHCRQQLFQPVLRQFANSCAHFFSAMFEDFVPFKPIFPALVTAIAFATMLSGCNKEQAAATPAQAPQVSVVTLKPQAVTLFNDLPGRTSAYRLAEV